MSTYLSVITVLLVLILLSGLWRIWKGPTLADRLLVSQLFGTAGVAILILLAIVQGQPALLNIALILALLAPITLITFTRLLGNK
jgi:multicomponent Na+:H+ antiporter subunit F